jgi:hypothetical protein
MVPAEVLVVDKVPVLGTGKIDMVGVANLVREHVAATPLLEPDRAPFTSRTRVVACLGRPSTTVDWSGENRSMAAIGPLGACRRQTLVADLC